MPVISYTNELTTGDILTALAFLTTLIAGVVSLRRFGQTLKNAHYAELDKLYFDILTHGIDKPWLLEPHSAEARANAGAYGAYAFLVFNFLETIHDRVRGNNTLSRTWYPIIQHEYALHGDWIRAGDNRIRFKKEFITFLEAGNWKKFC